MVEQMATGYPDEYVTQHNLFVAFADYDDCQCRPSMEKAIIKKILKTLNIEDSSLVFIPLYHSSSNQTWLSNTKYGSLFKSKNIWSFLHSDYLVDLDTSLKSTYKGTFFNASVKNIDRLPDLVTYHSLYLKLILNKDKL